MGVTKKHFYSPAQLQLADMYKALGHPARIALIEYLLSHHNANVMELQQSVQLSKSNVSRHLAILHKVGIIGYEAVINNCLYRVNPTSIDFISDYLFAISEKSYPLDERHYCPSLN